MLKKIFVQLLCVLFISPAFAQSATDLYNDGMKLLETKEYEPALAAFKNAIAKNAAYTDALYEAGWCCNELGKYSEAVGYLEKAAKLSPLTAKIFFELAYSDENAEKENDAIVNYKTALELYPEYYSAAQNLGDIYYKKEEYAAAVKYYKLYLQSSDADNYYYYKTGWAMNDLEEYADAITHLEKYEPGENDDIAKKYAEIGYANYSVEDNDEAIEAYTKALSAKPGYGTALRGLGNVYYDNTEEYDEAIKYFELALEKDEENSQSVYYKLGWLYNDAENYDDAIDVLEKAVDYDAEDPGTREELGYAYYMQQNNTNAMAQLDKAIALDPKSKLGYYYKGLTYLAMDKKEDAMQVYNKLKNVDAAQAEKLLGKINEK